ncbi:hypothetical protein L1987_63471 [Smallanthus sonchifolius]|uniref:Uncharacterized protein n=1 Tax=Smallanthus sonchifolius TaxID=185202 RepID=A0ACB9CDP6_9ASTR|nr:hypothetical protein L1987_63471 [Smallanthus sonchifolius]
MASETLISPSDSPLNSSKLLDVPATKPPPPPPPHSNRLQSSKWLHRLRAARGFPESDHIDLEHFLSTSVQKIDVTDSPLTRKIPPPDESFDDNGAVQGRDLINNVLSELFHMGEIEDKSRIKRKKSCRKQHCPRICVDIDRLPSSSRLKVKQVTKRVEQEDEEEEEEEKGHSQTEVTVIDTSVPCWKFEKLLYRSKNVWKVGDKKGNGDRKKRVNDNGEDVQKKKKKLKLKLCSSSKYVDKEQAMLLSKSDRMVAVNEKKRDNCSQVQEKSLCKKQIDEGSSVILIKSIPTTNKKNVSGVSNGCVKSMQR